MDIMVSIIFWMVVGVLSFWFVKTKLKNKIPDESPTKEFASISLFVVCLLVIFLIVFFLNTFFSWVYKVMTFAL